MHSICFTAVRLNGFTVTVTLLEHSTRRYMMGFTIEETSANHPSGGIITEEDLANYTLRIEEPLTFRLDSGHVVYSPRPPSGGAVYLFILNILNDMQSNFKNKCCNTCPSLNQEIMAFPPRDELLKFRFSNDSVSTVPKAKRTWHRMVESFKHAYALRTQLGDNQVGTPAFRDYVDEVEKIIKKKSWRNRMPCKRSGLNTGF
ncbi:GGT7-like protein [Mya arenaria]|uniref:GGT7-like protein n=1 Tax=Mya arenaria TaxID=6604 RepID=A0ABY7DL53_MYAAR|nr:GGT7-like protein [Mya arenaria]